MESVGLEKEVSLTLNIHIMKRTMYAVAVCAAVIMCLMTGCEPEEELTVENKLDMYLPYEMGNRVKFRSDKGEEAEMTVAVYERMYSDDGAGVSFEKTVAMLSADSTELLSVVMTSDNVTEDVVYIMAMFEHWLGKIGDSDLRAGEYYFADMPEEGEDFRAFVLGMDERLVSMEGYNVYNNYETGENGEETTGYCVIERGKGFVEFTTYGEVWRLVE